MNNLRSGIGKGIGIALSGGGVRAAAFHAGVLRYLAEQKLLGQVTHISTVSGGSLFMGLLFRYANYRWPSNESYIKKMLPNIRKILTTKSLQRSFVLNLCKPINWPYLLSRAYVLAKTIEKLWGIKKSLGALPKIPIWSINCTAGETGHRYRFKNKTMGEYKLGYAKVNDFTLAKAIAASAAFPLLIGPLVLKTRQFGWKKRITWNALQSKLSRLPFESLHLYDGGLYDNLGTEPLFDGGQQSFKPSANISYLLVSDAGTPPVNQAMPHPLNPCRFKRITDILQDQCRASRVRAFMNFLNQKNQVKATGAYIWIGTKDSSSIEQHKKGKEAFTKNLLEQRWLSEDDVKKAVTYPTTLRKLSESTFCLLEQHGYETAKRNIEMVADDNSIF